MAGVAFFNLAQSTLAVAATSIDSTIQLVSGGPWAGATGAFTVKIDDELIRCASVSGNTLTVDTAGRGFDGTSATPHALTDAQGNPTKVTGVVVRRDLTDAFARLDTAVSQTLTGPLVIPPAIGTAAVATSYGSMPVKLAETLLSGSVASISWTSIPAGFRHLKVDLYSRTDRVNVSDNVIMQFNGDTAANYDYQTISGTGATASAGEALAVAFVLLGTTCGASATANYFGALEARIKHYAGTTGNKQVNADSGRWTANTTGTGQKDQVSGHWRTAATAINRIDLKPSVGPNFVAGTLATLWGEP